MLLEFLFSEKSIIRINKDELNHFCNDMKVRNKYNQRNENIRKK